MKVQKNCHDEHIVLAGAEKIKHDDAKTQVHRSLHNDIAERISSFKTNTQTIKLRRDVSLSFEGSEVNLSTVFIKKQREKQISNS